MTDGDYLELKHRLDMIITIVEDQILNHRVTHTDSRLTALSSKSLEMLDDMYKLLGDIKNSRDKNIDLQNKVSY
jgi:hypothetical protein